MATPKGDVRYLADRGKGQPAFKVILEQRTQRAVDNRDCRPPSQRAHNAQSRGKLRPEHVIDHAHDAECTGLYHGHCMQQCTDRRRGDHGLRQPAVQRHQSRLHAQTRDQ